MILQVAKGESPLTMVTIAGQKIALQDHQKKQHLAVNMKKYMMKLKFNYIK